jgi:hypothetical protein
MLININGQSYNTWDEVPADIKAKVAAKLPDADGNGIPDVFEGNLSSLGNLAAAAAAQPGQPQTTFTSISIDGQQVDSLGQLHPEVQEMLRNTLGIYQAGSVAAPPPGTPGTTPVTPGAAVPPDSPWPLQPGQVMLNGVPTTVGAEPPRKSWWKRLFGG